MLNTLTALQNRVIALLAEGHSVTSAATLCDLHRTTIHHWKRTNPDFAHALADAKEDAQDHWNYEHRCQADSALDQLAKLMEDPNASPSVRLRAALSILKAASPVTTARRPRPANSSLSSQIDEPGIATYVRPTPKIGRNALCPCGSNKKYKQCCLNNKQATAA